MVTFDGTCQTDTSGSFTKLDTIMLNSLKTKEPCIHTKVEAASAQVKTLCVCVQVETDSGCHEPKGISVNICIRTVRGVFYS